MSVNGGGAGLTPFKQLKKLQKNILNVRPKTPSPLLTARPFIKFQFLAIYPLTFVVQLQDLSDLGGI